jgi:hypothetical protein
MKTLAFSLGALIVWSTAPLKTDDLEPIPPEIIAKVAKRLADDAAKFDNPQIKIEPDVDKANGLHKPQKAGLLVIPQEDLKEGEELAAKFKTERGAALALLFCYKIVPVIEGKPVDASQLREVKFTDDEGGEHIIHVLLLSVRQLDGDEYRLHAYGHMGKPLIDAKFAQTGDGTGPQPVAVTVKDVQDRDGNVVITAFGKYQASFKATYTGE